MIDQDATYENWKIRFPLCFERTGSCMGFGLQHGGGWNGIIEGLLTKIEARLQENPDLHGSDYGFQIDQIKEKFGTLRFYVSGADDTIFDWITAAEIETRTTCEACGQPGSLHCRIGGYWLYTRCTQCANPDVMEPYTREKHDV